MGSANKGEQLIIALEPEAAAIFCQERNMSDFEAETGSRSAEGVLSQPNTHYIVVDIGGKLYFYKEKTNKQTNKQTKEQMNKGSH